MGHALLLQKGAGLLYGQAALGRQAVYLPAAPAPCRRHGGFREYGLEPKRLRLVQQRPEKAPFLFLLEARRGGKPGLTVEPTLFIEGEQEGLSREMAAIYGEYRQLAGTKQEHPKGADTV